VNGAVRGVCATTNLTARPLLTEMASVNAHAEPAWDTIRPNAFRRPDLRGDPAGRRLGFDGVCRSFDDRVRFKSEGRWRARTKQELVDAARSAALFAFLVFSTALVAVVAWARIEGSSQLRVTEDQADSVLITHGAAPSWDRRAWHVVLHLAVVIAVSGLLSLSDRHPIQNSAISRKVRIATLN